MKNFILSLFVLNTIYLPAMLALALLAGFILNTSPAFAETACVKVYGGGEGFCLPATTPTPTTPQQPDGFPPTTKGGVPVFPSPDQLVNPPTGPEALVLIPLLSSGIIGYFLRKLST